MIADSRLQDPQETLSHSLDWTDWLAVDTIATSSWAISPSGPTISGTSHTTVIATAFLAGVSLGGIYALTNSITTAAGETGERSITIRGFSE